MKTGICYYITADFLPYAIASLLSIRRIYPDLPAEIYSHEDIPQVDIKDVHIIKVTQPVVLESKKATVIRIKWMIPLLTEFETFIISDVDIFYNTDITEILLEASEGFICANYLGLPFICLPEHFTKYNDGFIVAQKEIFNQHFGNLNQYWNERHPEVWSSMWIFNEKIFLAKRDNKPIPMYDVPEKYLWLIENKSPADTLEDINYHLAFGNENEVDKALVKIHPAYKEYFKLIPHI